MRPHWMSILFFGVIVAAGPVDVGEVTTKNLAVAERNVAQRFSLEQWVHLLCFVQLLTTYFAVA
jgi:hypothetical protein